MQARPKPGLERRAPRPRRTAYALEGTRSPVSLKTVSRIWAETRSNITRGRTEYRGEHYCNNVRTAALEVRDWDEDILKLNRLKTSRATWTTVSRPSRQRQETRKRKRSMEIGKPGQDSRLSGEERGRAEGGPGQRPAQPRRGIRREGTTVSGAELV